MADSLHRLHSAVRKLFPPGPEIDAVLAVERRNALALADAVDDRSGAAAATAYAFVGNSIGALAFTHPWTEEEIARLGELVARELGSDLATAQHELFRRALEGIGTGGCPGLPALQAALTVYRAFAPVTEGSVWAAECPGSVECLAIIGADRPSRRARAAARETLLTGQHGGNERSFVHSVAISRWDRPQAALVFRARPAERRRALARAREMGNLVGTILEQASLLSTNALRESALLESSERRLCRLGYDIHDGPIQDIAMLAGDVRLLRRQVERGLLADAPTEVLLGRLDDFDARLVGLDRELRELALSLDRSSATEVPLAEALRRQIAVFQSRTKIAVRLDFRGEADLTASQRFALLALVREGLVNVRQHSGATEVQIRVATNGRRTLASITDNGRGFDVERTLRRAARGGRLGLVGIGERLRLLGGWLALDSRPGGPTRLAVVLPRWEATGQRKSRVRAA